MARQRGGGAAQQQKQQQGEKKQQQQQQRRSNPLPLSAAPSKTLLPGRHPCSCQARLHELVRNCMGCGKVVCAQEGSGPCFFCSTLVCTNQEKEILDRRSRKSAELYKQLTGKDMPKEGAISLAAVADSLQSALKFRDTLLEADADSERRTRVNDLESDFHNIESNVFLSAEERAAVAARKRELEQIREKRRRMLVVNIDVGTRTTVEEKAQHWETAPAYDPVVRQILERSEQRRRAAEAEEAERANENADAWWTPIGFVPKYQGDTSVSTIEQEWADVECLGRQSEEAAALETERRGYAICLPQPEAALVANGFIKAIRWPEDPMLVGPLFICSAVTEGAAGGEKAAVAAAIKKYKLPESASLLDFSSGSVHGRSFLADTLTMEEYKQESGNVDSLPVVGSERDRGFVLVFSASEPLLMSIPHIPPVAPGTVYQLDGALKMALSHVFAAA